MEHQKTTLQPVVHPGDAWHLASGEAFERAQEIVRRASADGLPSDGIGLFSQELIRSLGTHAAASWRAYFRNQASALGGDGRPAGLGFDDVKSLPVLEVRKLQPDTVWQAGHMEGFGTVATPFQPVATDQFPAGTQFLKIRSPHHAATAALDEVMVCALRDITGAFLAEIEDESWRRLNRVIQLYRTGAQFAFKSLGDDDFVGWKADIPLDCEIGSAASLISRLASTSRAQCCVAMHLVACWLQAMADSVEAGRHPNRKLFFLRQVEQAAGDISQALDALNKVATREKWNGAVPGEVRVVMRPVPVSIPLLALIPSGVDASTVVTAIHP